MSNLKEQIVRCVHCGNRTSIEVCHRETACEEVFDEKGEGIAFMNNYFFLTRCKTCDSISLYVSCEADAEPENLNKATLLYPYSKSLGSSVPTTVMHDYEDAKKVEKISPGAFVVLIRKALERLCIDKNAKGYDLKDKLDNLAEKGLIPETLSRMSHAVRLLGNVGAHADEISITADEASIIHEFFIAIIEYVYIAPDKINSLTSRLSNKEI